ncbi:MAG: OmpH family outer membrane protein [Bacteroidota bacterium]
MLRSITRLTAVLLLLPVLAAVAPQAQAQALKVGFTDHELLILNMNEYRSVQEQMQQAMQSSQSGLQEKYAQYQEMLDRYQKQQALLSPERRQEREQELLTLQNEIQAEAQQADQSLSERQAELMQPILERVQDAINEVAEAKGLDLVLRTQINIEPVLLYVNPDTVEDITLDVAQRLGIDVSQAEAEGDG